MKTTLKAIVLLVLYTLVIYIGYVAGAELFGDHTAPAQPEQVTLLTRVQTQQILKDLGYYMGKIDGDIGRKSNDAWEKWECQQHAAEHEVK